MVEKKTLCLVFSVFGLMELSVAVHAGAVGSDHGRGYFEEARGS